MIDVGSIVSAFIVGGAVGTAVTAWKNARWWRQEARDAKAHLRKLENVPAVVSPGLIPKQYVEDAIQILPKGLREDVWRAIGGKENYEVYEP